MRVETLPDRLLLFDGVCNLCNALVQFTIKRDPDAKFKFASLQSDIGQKILEECGLPLDDIDTFLYIDHGKAYLRSDAGLHTCKDIGGIWKVFSAFIIVPRPIRDFIYDLLAKYRYRIFGRKNACMIPTPELKSRFL